MPKYIVTASALRIRSGPGTAFPIVGMLYKNNTVQGDEVNNDWVHITTANNLAGWSHRSYLQVVDETPPPDSGTAYRVDASTLNVRLGPGTNYAVSGSLKKGEVVEGLAISADNQWVQIRKTGGINGWCSLKYMTKVVTPPPTQPNGCTNVRYDRYIELSFWTRRGIPHYRSSPSRRAGCVSKRLARLEVGQLQNQQ